MSARAEAYAEAAQGRARRAEERALFHRLAHDPTPAAQEALMQRFMPLARQLARRYKAAAELEDLEQVASLGLLKAIGRFDPERGLAFSSFAFPTIVGELKRYLRDLGWSVRVPRDLQDLYVRLEQQTAELSAELGRAPTIAEMAERADTTVERVLEARQAATARRSLSLDAPQPGENAADFGIDVGVEECGFAVAEDAAMLGGLLATLPARARAVVRLRFQNDLTQREIGAIVGISQMQVSRVLRESIRQLRTAARGQAPPSSQNSSTARSGPTW